MKYIQTIRKGETVRRYFKSPTGFRVTLPEIDADDFSSVYGAALERAEREIAAQSERLSAYTSGKAAQRVNSFYGKMAARMRYRAESLSVPCTLSADDLRDISEAQGNVCALTGLAFAFTQSDRGRGSPFAPSPDRMDSRAGYVQGNVRMVCQMANYARLDFSDEEFYAMCEAATRHRKRTQRERNPVNQTCKLSGIQALTNT